MCILHCNALSRYIIIGCYLCVQDIIMGLPPVTKPQQMTSANFRYRSLQLSQMGAQIKCKTGTKSEGLRRNFTINMYANPIKAVNSEKLRRLLWKKHTNRQTSRIAKEGVLLTNGHILYIIQTVISWRQARLLKYVFIKSTKHKLSVNAKNNQLNIYLVCYRMSLRCV